MLARSVISLLSITSAVTVVTAGSSSTLKGSQYDDVNMQEQTFLAVFELTASGGTSPTVDAIVETSWDGTNWHTVASMTQLSGAGSAMEIKTVTNMGKYVRAKVTPGGTAAPDTTGTVRLASSGGLT